MMLPAHEKRGRWRALQTAWVGISLESGAQQLFFTSWVVGRIGFLVRGFQGTNFWPYESYLVTFQFMVGDFVWFTGFADTLLVVLLERERERELSSPCAM